MHTRAKRALPRLPTDVTMHCIQCGPPAYSVGRALDRAAVPPGVVPAEVDEDKARRSRQWFWQCAARAYSAHSRAKEAAAVPYNPPERLLRIKHRQGDLGFTSALLVHDGSSPQEWCVRLESPAELDVFREHLAQGRSMAFTLITRAGDLYQGEAAVARISPPSEEATIVTLSGVGPLLAS